MVAGIWCRLTMFRNWAAAHVWPVKLASGANCAHRRRGGRPIRFATGLGAGPMMISVMRVLRWLLAAMAVSGLGLVCAQPLDMIRESRLREAALAWPSVMGRILDTTIVPRVGRRTYYGVNVSYDYIASGRHFAGD